MVRSVLSLDVRGYVRPGIHRDLRQLLSQDETSSNRAISLVGTRKGCTNLRKVQGSIGSQSDVRYACFATSSRDRSLAC